MSSMHGIVHRSYGEPERLEFRGDLAAPVPKEDEVLVRMRASCVHADVWHVIAGQPRALRLMGAGLRRPKVPIPGTDVSGIVEAVGARVNDLAVGDAVFGETLRGMQWKNGGAWAELVTAPADRIIRKPEAVSHDEAAGVATTGLIALDVLMSQGNLRDGSHVLVNGAGGAVGSIVVQLALAHECIVTAVDTTTKLDGLRALGAQHVVDCTRDDYTTGEARYDVIIDIPCNHHWKRNAAMLNRMGRYVPVGHDGYGTAGATYGSMRHVIPLAIRGTWDRRLAGFSSGTPTRARLTELARLLESGQLTPRIEARYSLDQAACALRHLMGGTVQGRIVLTSGSRPS